jgi:hypothetical protein
LNASLPNLNGTDLSIVAPANGGVSLGTGVRPRLSGEITSRSAEMLDIAVVPANAGTQRLVTHPKSMDPGVRRGDEWTVLNFRKKIQHPAMAEISFFTVMFSPDSNGRSPGRRGQAFLQRSSESGLSQCH